jgi:hypothetical protein
LFDRIGFVLEEVAAELKARAVGLGGGYMVFRLWESIYIKVCMLDLTADRVRREGDAEGV